MSEFFLGPPDAREVKATVTVEGGGPPGLDSKRFRVRLEDAADSGEVEVDLAASARREHMEEAIEHFANREFAPENRLRGVVAVYEATGPLAINTSQASDTGLQVRARL